MSTQEIKLKAIADAIREKEGSTALIPAKDFPTRILALETGGLPDGIRTISAEANVSGRGDVSGGGMASDGTRIIVRAAAKGGYKFANWTERGSSVSTEADYAFDVTKDRDLTAVFNVKTSRLPSGYTEVEYIQTDRACGIDTGMQPDTGYDRVVMDIEPTEISLTGEEDFCGMVAYGSSKYLYCSLWRNRYNQICSRVLTNTIVTSNITLGFGRAVIDMNLQTKRISVGDEFYTSNHASGTAKLNNNLFLFVPGTPSSSWASVPARLYSAKIYHNGVLKRDFVPCVNRSGVAGLYDLVESNFHQNSKSGVLTAGPEV